MTLRWFWCSFWIWICLSDTSSSWVRVRNSGLFTVFPVFLTSSRQSSWLFYFTGVCSSTFQFGYPLKRHLFIVQVADIGLSSRLTRFLFIFSCRFVLAGLSAFYCQYLHKLRHQAEGSESQRNSPQMLIKKLEMFEVYLMIWRTWIWSVLKSAVQTQSEVLMRLKWILASRIQNTCWSNSLKYHKSLWSREGLSFDPCCSCLYIFKSVDEKEKQKSSKIWIRSNGSACCAVRRSCRRSCGSDEMVKYHWTFLFKHWKVSSRTSFIYL